MLVPSEDSNIDSARLANAHRTEAVGCTESATAMVGFISPLFCEVAPEVELSERYARA